MASTPSAHVKNLRDNQSQEKESSLFSKGSLSSEISERKGKHGNQLEIMQETLRYERYCKYWSILSNVAAIISVSSVIYGTFRKRSWF